jgi:hypothetical protein
LAVALPDFNLSCERCHENLNLQKENGCFEDSPIPDKWQIGNHTFQRCPIKVVTLQSYAYIRAYNWMQMGFLPNPGGWTEQPAKFIRVMDVIGTEISKDQKEEREKIKRMHRS